MFEIYEQLGDPSRRLILAQLLGGARRVSDICASTGLKQPNVSNHLARLRERTLVVREKIGREVYYSLASWEIESVVETVTPSSEASLHRTPEELARLYASAAVMGDRLACSRLVDGFLRFGGDMLTLFENVLGAAMHLVGSWYDSHEIDEADEHLASEITESILSRAVAARLKKPPTGFKVLLGCAAGEQHTIPLQMARSLMEASGWEVRYLGANVPSEALAAHAQKFVPDLILVSATNTDNSESVHHLLKICMRLRPDTLACKVILGGFDASRHRSSLLSEGADYVANSLRDLFEDYMPSFHDTPAGKASLH